MMMDAVRIKISTDDLRYDEMKFYTYESQGNLYDEYECLERGLFWNVYDALCESMMIMHTDFNDKIEFHLKVNL